MAAEREIPLAVLMRYFRVPTGPLPVDYPGREVLLGSRITNISVSGVFVSTQKPLAEGTELAISFRLPNGTTDINVDTVVRWCKTKESKHKDQDLGMGMGLEFTRIARKDLKAVQKFVKEFLTRMRKGG